ncbi:hypothetical protein INT43_000251 [Umbelopsis isabellina]|uniref:Cytochrome P450 n=1 Tax=Mortierella isabellina TaxID=91625 RepID=A0A8H7PFB8_MORIS|nr:hypothetical protein INT43_000251 [Umbelopsis isabellina]
MNWEQYINNEQINKSIHKVTDALSKLNRTEVAGIAVGSLAVYYIANTFAFDPLRSIPGPLAAKLSRFYDLKTKAGGKKPEIIEELHQKYGDVVRIGPNHVSIRDPNAVKQIYGTERFLKSDFYDVFKIDGNESIFSTKSSMNHGRFRRIMGPGFSQSTLDNLEDIFMDNGILLFLDKLDKNVADKNMPANLFNEFHLLAFDVLGELAFGKSFDMVKMNSHPFTSWLKARSSIIPLLTTFPMLNKYPMLVRNFFPKANEALGKIKEFSHGTLEERAADNTTNRRDFAHILVEARNSNKKGVCLTEGECAMASVVLTIAGTDTTSNTMTFTAYLLGKNPHVEEKLYQELVKAMPSRDSVLKYKDARKESLPYLWAVIMEVTRMMPVVPVGMPRVCPKGGEVIAGKYIPEGTIVEVPVWSIHYHPDIFEDPYTFRPERWLEHGADELTKYNIAFSTGPRMCAGKNLAMMEMTLVLAHLYRRFDVKLAKPNEELQLSAQFITKPTDGQMNVVIRSRKD